MMDKLGDVFYKILNSDEFTINGDLDKDSDAFNQIVFTQADLLQLRRELKLATLHWVNKSWQKDVDIITDSVFAKYLKFEKKKIVGEKLG